MKIFISWSGPLSRDVALLLRSYIPSALQGLDGKVFMSEEDIRSGDRWLNVLLGELRESSFGIVCMTPDNLDGAWVLFESGALASQPEPHVCALMLGGLTKDKVTGPLRAFHHQSFTMSGIKKLLSDINRAQEQPINRALLDDTFKHWWPSLKREYDIIVAQSPPAETQLGIETDTFRRTIVDVGTGNSLTARMGEEVERIRRAVRDKLRRAGYRPGNSDIRANVYLPNHRNPRPGCAFDLCMHPELRRQMNHPAEFEIRFAPGETGTGLAFEEGHRRVLRKRDFRLSSALSGMIHPKLKWFISTPIKGTDSVTLGVLNVDGIGFDVRQSVLDSTADLIESRAARLGEMMDDCPRVAVSVRYAKVIR